MDAIISFYAELPGRIADIFVYASGNPAVVAVAALAGAATTAAAYINFRSWRKGA